jgi:hypothetical protein
VTINNLIVILTLTLLVGSGATARINPCTGKGLKIFFVNGLFNNFDQANKNLQEFRNPSVYLGVKKSRNSLSVRF